MRAHSNQTFRQSALIGLPVRNIIERCKTMSSDDLDPAMVATLITMLLPQQCEFLIRIGVLHFDGRRITIAFQLHIRAVAHHSKEVPVNEPVQTKREPAADVETTGSTFSRSAGDSAPSDPMPSLRSITDQLNALQESQREGLSMHREGLSLQRATYGKVGEFHSEWRKHAFEELQAKEEEEQAALSLKRQERLVELRFRDQVSHQLDELTAAQQALADTSSGHKVASRPCGPAPPLGPGRGRARAGGTTASQGRGCTRVGRGAPSSSAARQTTSSRGAAAQPAATRPTSRRGARIASAFDEAPQLKLTSPTSHTAPRALDLASAPVERNPWFGDQERADYRLERANFANEQGDISPSSIV